MADAPQTGITGAAPATDPTQKAGDVGQMLQQMMSMLQQLGQALQQGQPQQQPTAGPGPVEQPAPAMMATSVGLPQAMGQFSADPAPETNPDPTADPCAGAQQAGVNTALLKRLEAVEAKFSALEQAHSVELHAGKLTEAGFGTEQVTAFRARANEHGLASAVSFAAGLEHIGPSEPPAHWSGELRGQAPDAPALQKYAQQGHEVLADAREWYRSWERSESDLDFETFYTANKDPDAFLAAKAGK